jgi:hypothetical protein
VLALLLWFILLQQHRMQGNKVKEMLTHHQVKKVLKCKKGWGSRGGELLQQCEQVDVHTLVEMPPKTKEAVGQGM